MHTLQALHTESMEHARELCNLQALSFRISPPCAD